MVVTFEQSSKVILGFFNFYNKLLYDDNVIENLTLEELVSSAAVADYLGYETITKGNNEVRLLDLLVTELTISLLLNEVPQEIYHKISRTIVSLIEDKLETNCILLEKKQILTCGDIKIQVLTDERKIAGFVNFHEEKVAVLYTDILTPPEEYSVVPSSHIHLDAKGYHGYSLPNKSVVIVWSNYYLNNLSLNKYIWTIDNKKSFKMVSNQLLDVKDMKDITIPRIYEAIRLLRYCNYLVGESFKANPNPPWQEVDKEEKEHYQETRFLDKALNIMDLNNGEEIFYLNISSFDEYLIDDSGKYLLIYRRMMEWLELYDISQKIRLFKKFINSHKLIKGGLVLDVHNQFVTIYLEEKQGIHTIKKLQKYDFKGDLLFVDVGVNERVKKVPLKGFVLTLSSFKVYNHEPVRETSECRYQVILKDASDEHLKEVALETEYLIAESDVVVSPNGRYFAITYRNTIYHYFVVSEDDREKLMKKLL